MYIYATPALLPEFEGAPPEVLITNGFTIGRRYLVRYVFGHNDSLGATLNDNGHERFIPMDGSETAHILCTRDPRKRWPDLFPSPAGYFEIEHSIVRREP